MLAQEKELRKAEQMATHAEHSRSRGRSGSRGVQSQSPQQEQPVKLAKVDPNSDAPMDEQALNSSAQVARKREEERAMLRAEESADNAEAVARALQQEALADKRSPAKKPTSKAGLPPKSQP